MWSSIVIGLAREQNHYHNNGQGSFQNIYHKTNLIYLDLKKVVNK